MTTPVTGECTPDTILIVEDDSGVAVLERRRLECAGYRVLVAACAEEAWEYITRGEAELALLDHALPGGRTGLDVFAEWKSRGHDLPVIMMAGQSDNSLIIQAFRAGIRDFVVKSPAYLDDLPEAVARILAQERTKRSLEASERRFRAIFDQASVGIAHRRLDGSWVLTNSRLHRILGYTAEELANKQIADFTDPEDYAIEAEHKRALAQGESSTYTMEKRVIRKDGTAVWVNVTCLPVPSRGTGWHRSLPRCKEPSCPRDRARSAVW